MLMVSMNVMAQRETLTFNGIMANFPHGGSAETVLTIKPDGIGGQAFKQIVDDGRGELVSRVFE